ncbi:IS200/IS605 family transposase [Caviibacterium pharyngocola]|uniref:Transposase n=1 Tax=Caviibacterium pharyngocola TaxID=28159 RepID=A0A2M8RUD2_9PAST|nr:IS200/IS605 family transposase [Caviibacterium pharyngocola]PJG82491.1 transposase [Caviibacterium pharyngocola]
MSYTRLLYHIVFRTKNGKPAITVEHEKILYTYIWKFIQERNSVLYRVNGMPDHIHIFTALHSDIAVADFVRELKNATHLLLEKHHAEFPQFYAWSKGYCAISYSDKEREKIVNYIKNKKEHHQYTSFLEETKYLLNEAGIEYDERYFDRNI